MAGKDKAMRAFVRGAIVYGVLGVFFAIFIHGLMDWVFRDNATLFPKRLESVLWIAPWLLVGGLLGVGKYFYRERSVQFNIRLLLLITVLVSMTGAWGVLARERYRGEQQALAGLNEKFDGALGYTSLGFIFKTVTTVDFYIDTDSASILFVRNQLKFFPSLCKVNFSEGTTTESDLAFLKAAFPDIVIVQE